MLKAERGPKTQVIDLADRTVLPGLIDSHLHAVMFDASYVVVVNALGLKVSSITRDMPDPPHGPIVKDEKSEPSGASEQASTSSS